LSIKSVVKKKLLNRFGGSFSKKNKGSKKKGDNLLVLRDFAMIGGRREEDQREVWEGERRRREKEEKRNKGRGKVGEG
jgi:hypothetical protein